MPLKTLVLLALSGCIAGTSGFGQKPLPQPAGKLVYAVILSRHGVRSPTAANDSLNQYSREPWPRWEVEPGELTGHGGKLMKIMGIWYRGWLGAEGLWPATTDCAGSGSVYVRADVGQRTRESSRAIAEGMFPGCGVETHLASGESDPLFHPVAAGSARGDAAVAKAAVSGRIGEHLEALTATLQHQFGVLEDVLGKKSILGLPAGVTGTEEGLADIRGPIRTGSTLAENLMLEYAEGMSGKDLGWGRLDEAHLNEIMAIHTAYADLARRTEYLARLQGSNLLSHMLRSMEQAVSGKLVKGALGKPGDLLLLLGGHDTNISHVAGMLHLSWLLPGYQRDDVPPGGALVFELRRGRDASLRVRVVFVAQTLQQMRESTALNASNAPPSAPVFIPGCNAYDCDWSIFAKIAGQAIDPAYVLQP